MERGDEALSCGKHFIVMAGLDPAIHAFLPAKQDVDARVKPGHDGVN
jgi:hypothetical protein